MTGYANDPSADEWVLHIEWHRLHAVDFNDWRQAAFGCYWRVALDAELIEFPVGVFDTFGEEGSENRIDSGVSVHASLPILVVDLVTLTTICGIVVASDDAVDSVGPSVRYDPGIGS